MMLNMKYIIIVFILLTSYISADEFDFEDASSQKEVLFPMTKKELSKFIPVLPRMLTKEELLEKK